MTFAVHPTVHTSPGPYRHGLFGLAFESDEAIPGLCASSTMSDAAPVRIAFGPVPRALDYIEYEDATVQANASEYLFTYPDVLRLCIQRDTGIVVERLDRCDPVRLWTLVLGVGASIAGFWRGFVPLHASAVVCGGKCIALAGQSGFGKSTVAASLSSLGFTVHADDLCLAQPRDGGFVVGSGVAELRLWDDAAQFLNYHAPYAKVPEIAKSVFRLPAARPVCLPLERLYALEFADQAEAPGIYRVTGVAALQLLVGHLRMRLGLLAVGDRRVAFETLAAISERVEIYRFVRPQRLAELMHWSERLASHMTSS